MREHDLIQLAGRALNRLALDGQKVVATDSMEEFEAKLSEIGKPPNHPMISHQEHDFAREDALGLLLFSKEQLIGGVAARIVRLGSDSLSDHWEASYRRLYPGDGATVRASSQAARNIRGDVVYEGELYIHNEWRQHKVNTPALMHYLHVITALKWRPSWLYGFIRTNRIGTAPHYGFAHVHLAPLDWLRVTDRRGSNEYLVSVTYEELVEHCSVLVGDPDRIDELFNR